MYDLAKMFLHCLNHWKLETPQARKQHSPNEDVSAYKINYTRWLCYCHVPAFCDRLALQPLYNQLLININCYIIFIIFIHLSIQ
jgi:hypothetical protein